MDLNRRLNETDTQYQIRLTLAKQAGMDIDWSEIAELVGDGRSSEAYRKDSYGIRRYHNCMGDINNNETLIEIRKEKQIVSDLRVDVNRKIRQYSRMENIIDEVKSHIEGINDFKFVDNEMIQLFDNGNDAILMLSDIHYDGDKIVVDRFNHVIDYAINKCKLHKINRLNVAILGDIINGELHTTSRIENRENIANQIVNMAKLLSEGIYKLSKNIPYVTVAMCNGNHARSVINYKDAMTTDTYLPIMDELLKLRLENVHNVIFVNNLEDREMFCVIGIRDRIYAMTHGDSIKGIEKNGIPAVEGFIGQKIDYLLLGHFHKPADYTYYQSRIIVNGAMKNEFDYSKKTLLNTKCFQKLLILDTDGDVECNYDIKL